MTIRLMTSTTSGADIITEVANMNMLARSEGSRLVKYMGVEFEVAVSLTGAFILRAVEPNGLNIEVASKALKRELEARRRRILN